MHGVLITLFTGLVQSIVMSVFVCLSVCLLACLDSYTAKLHQIFCACWLRPWCSSSVAAFWYVICYVLRFSGGHYIFTL